MQLILLIIAILVVTASAYEEVRCKTTAKNFQTARKWQKVTFPELTVLVLLWRAWGVFVDETKMCLVICDALNSEHRVLSTDTPMLDISIQMRVHANESSCRLTYHSNSSSFYFFPLSNNLISNHSLIRWMMNWPVHPSLCNFNFLMNHVITYDI